MIPLTLPWTIQIHSINGLEADFGVTYIHNETDAFNVVKAITALLDQPNNAIARRTFVECCGDTHLASLVQIAKELPPRFWVRVINPQGKPIHEGLSRTEALLNSQGVRVVMVAP